MPPTPQQPDAGPSSLRARPLGSKKQRPCDYCRRQKHSCHIPVAGQPCTDCSARKLECTFSAPALKRKGPPASSAREHMSQAKRPSMRQISAGIKSEDPPEDTAWSMQSLLQSIRKPLFPEDDEGEDSDEAYFDSLDMAYDDYEELHYLEPMAVANNNGLASSSGSSGVHPGQQDRQEYMSYNRQGPGGDRRMPSDALPAVFARNPALIYGRSGPESVTMGYLKTSMELLGPETIQELINLFKETTLKAFPLVNRLRFEAAMRGEPGSGTFPASFMCCVIAHTAHTYRPALQQHSHTLWKSVLSIIEDEYRLPRLQTLQTSITLLLSEPHSNHGQNGISLGRAVGCAHLLGLHVDCARWKLPRWERSVRRRIWWTLLILDTWRSYIQGRPRFIHQSDHNVRLPKLKHSDWGEEVENDEKDAMLSFIGMAGLASILARILQEFHTTKAVVSPPKGVERMIIVESIGDELDTFEKSLSPGLRLPIVRGTTSCAVGVRSMQAAHLGVKIALIRLTLTSADEDNPRHLGACLEAAVKVSVAMVEFLEALDAQDYQSVWFPYSCFTILNCATLLVRILVQAGGPNAAIGSQASNLLLRLTTNVKSGHQSCWSTATSAKTHLETLLTSLQPDLPLAQALLAILSDAPPAPPPQEAELPLEDIPMDFAAAFLNPMADDEQNLWNGQGWIWDSHSVTWDAQGVEF